MLVDLTFVLDEEVTPSLFAERIVQACGSYGALREGEGVRVPGMDGLALLVSHETQTDRVLATIFKMERENPYPTFFVCREGRHDKCPKIVPKAGIAPAVACNCECHGTRVQMTQEVAHG